MVKNSYQSFHQSRGLYSVPEGSCQQLKESLGLSWTFYLFLSCSIASAPRFPPRSAPRHKCKHRQSGRRRNSLFVLKYSDK